jgi:plastocyanin
LRRIVIAATLLLALVTAGCGGDDGGGEGATGATGSSGEGATGATSPTGGGCEDLTGEGDVFTITISGFAFAPDCFTASAAQGISIVNEDGAAHTFTMDGTQIDVEIAPGTTFNGEPIAGVVEPGTYEFHCRFHSSMTGEVTVVA